MPTRRSKCPKRTHGPASNAPTTKKRAQLLSSCSMHILLIASSLWFFPATPLKAMKEEETREQGKSFPLGKEKAREQNDDSSQSFYEKDAHHPLTQKFWKDKDLSKRLVRLKPYIDSIKDDVINRKKNLTEVIKENLQQYKEILQCKKCSSSATVYDLKDIHLDENHVVPFIDRNKPKMPEGWSKANVIVFPYQDETAREQNTDKENPPLIAIKKFDNIEAGLKELFESLIAIELNPAPHKLKMARIYDAVICPHNSLSIIMEAVGIQDIHTFLSTNSLPKSINAIKACAEYLAKFHIKNHLQMNQSINRKTYLDYVAWFFKTLLQNPLQEEHESFKLLSFSPTEELSENEYVQSNNIASLLLEHEQENFERLVTVVCNVFKENAENIFQSLGEGIKLDSFVLTRTHGDAHAHNFFYDPSPCAEEDVKIPSESSLCMSMIDYSSILKTAMPLGHPEEDVGRFLAALWNWRAIVEGHTDEEASRLQNEFLNRYLDIIRQSEIVDPLFQESFERAFKLNCSFYKLRYYKVLFNAQKDKKNLENDREIKKILLRSWIQENADLEAEGILSSIAPQKMHSQKLKSDFWGEPVCEKKDIKHWLPHESDEFIDRAVEGTEESSLEHIWKAFHLSKNQAVTQTTTLLPFSSAVIITGMGGVGKTSETLQYGHEALKNNAYDLIYFLHAGTEASLFKSYRSLLEYVGRSPKGKDNESVIKDLQEYVRSKKCLLIYDNVPDYYEKKTKSVPAPKFLKNKIPQKAHILISSRCDKGWEEKGGEVIKLDVFQRKESINYLMNVTGLKIKDEKIAGDLAQALEDLPLALSHAGHYIKLVGGNAVSKETFSDYLEGFKHVQTPVKYLGENRHSIVDQEPEITYAHLIARTLRMTETYFNRLGKTHITELAKKLMNYCAYLDPDSVTEELFPEYGDNVENVKEVLQLLTSLSLIKNINDHSLFSIHRLEQLVIRDELEEKGQHEEVINMLSNSFYNLFSINSSSKEENNITKLESYLFHVRELLDHFHKFRSASMEDERTEWIGLIMSLVELNDISQKVDFLNDSENLKKLLNKSASVIFRSVRNVMDNLDRRSTKTALHSLGMIGSILQQILQASDLQGELSKKSVADIRKRMRMLEKTLDKNSNTEDIPEWLEELIHQSHPKIRTALGTLYPFGFCGPPNYKKAFEWCLNAADMGYADAQFKLALLYAAGLGVPQKDEKAALSYLKKAAKQGHVLAQFHLGRVYQFGENLSEIVVEYKRAHGIFYLSRMMLGGTLIEIFGESKNDDKAIKWYELASKQGLREASTWLASLYFSKNNYPKARQLYEKAANLGCAEARYALGQMYENGLGGIEDHNQAKLWISEAAAQGYGQAQLKLGGIAFADGNFGEAIEWLKKAAKQNLPEAGTLLMVIATLLSLDADDIKEGKKSMLRALEQGDDEDVLMMLPMVKQLEGMDDSYKKSLREQLEEEKNKEITLEDNDQIFFYNNINEQFNNFIALRKALASQGFESYLDDQNLTLYRDVIEKTDRMLFARHPELFGDFHEGGDKHAFNIPLLDQEIRLGNKNTENTITTQSSPGETSTISLTTETQKLKREDEETFSKTGIKIIRGEDGKVKDRIMPPYIDSVGDDRNQQKFEDLTLQGDAESIEAIEENEIKALEWLTRAADMGDAQAQFDIGEFWESRRNYDKAMEWFNKAAMQNNALSQYRLGLLYFKKQNGEQDDVQAFNWLGQAAAQGNMDALYYLGLMYEEGRGGVGVNYDEAFQLYKQAAEAGQEDAQFRLGVMYAEGHGVKKNDVKALEWYAKAAKQGSEDAQNALSRLYLKISKDEIKALKKNSIVVTQGRIEVRFKLGEIYKDNKDIDEKETPLTRWYKYIKAAEQGDADAMFNLGIIYENGQGIKKNNTKAMKWYTAASKQGHPHAHEAPFKLRIGPINTQEHHLVESRIDSSKLLAPTIVEPPLQSQRPISQSISLTVEQQKLKNEDKKTYVQQGIKIIHGEDGKIKEKVMDSSLFLTEDNEDADKDRDKTSFSTTVASTSTLASSSSYQKASQSLSLALFLNREQEWDKTKELIDRHNQQGENYFAVALQHAEERKFELAEHCGEEADKLLQEAEDAQIALELQQQEYLESSSSPSSK